VETLRAYRTADNTFAVYKTIGNRKMQPEEVSALVRDRKVGPLDGFRSKLGRPYAAILQLDEANKVRFVFENRRAEGEGADPNAPELDLSTLPAVAQCPRCKAADVVETPSAFICRNARAEGDKRCAWRISRTLLGKVLPTAQIAKLVTEGKTDLVEGFRSNRTKKLFSAFLILKKNGDLGFEFPPREPRAKKAFGKKAAAPAADQPPAPPPGETEA